MTQTHRFVCASLNCVDCSCFLCPTPHSELSRLPSHDALLMLGWLSDGSDGAFLLLGFLLGLGLLKGLKLSYVQGHRFGHSLRPLILTNSAWSSTQNNLLLLFVSKPVMCGEGPTEGLVYFTLPMLVCEPSGQRNLNAYEAPIKRPWRQWCFQVHSIWAGPAG